MSGNPYDVIRYTTFPKPETHPDCLAAVGTLFGMTPPPVAGCRVLEIGCGSGDNLIPMAYALPDSRFTGIDLAAEPVAAGRAKAAELGIENLTLIERDLRDAGAVAGEFDYIVAHGVYSWIPADARDALLALCRRCLAPPGIAYVSYNAYPGRHIRQMLREMMLYHSRRAESGPQRIEESLWFAKFLAERRMVSEAWEPLIDAELKTTFERSPESLFHDDLGEINDPVYFHEFAAHATRHGLQYLGEADPHEMFDHRGVLGPLGEDVLEREQYLDFLKGRRFRQTLLCREEVRLERNPRPEQMDGFLFSSPARRLEGPEWRYQGAHGITITVKHKVVEQVAGALAEAFPLPLGFEELAPYAGDVGALREILFTLATGGFADLHVYAFPCEEAVTEKPVASALARIEARRSRLVTNLCHRAIELDEIGRQLILLLDGTRDRDAIAADLAKVPGGPPADEIARLLGQNLEWLARMALLVG